MPSVTKKQVTLPVDLEEATIDSMTIGQHGYTVPWGMWVDSERNCWLHPKYTIHDRPFGTAVMRIERQMDGYHVWPLDSHRYTPQKEHGYVSPADTEFIPVAELHI